MRFILDRVFLISKRGGEEVYIERNILTNKCTGLVGGDGGAAGHIRLGATGVGSRGDMGELGQRHQCRWRRSRGIHSRETKQMVPSRMPS
jgi:hypothetical protein